MFERIGVLHFPERHDAPICTLEDAISKHSNVRNSLIVLPEAFNNGEVYNGGDCPPRIPADLMLRELSAIAKRHSLVFVSGLLHEMAGVIRNSAYVIDGCGSRLMVHKGANDDIKNPIEAEGVWVGCLICSDAGDNHRYRVTENA